jgi:CheY-like chemotaxis protein
MNTDKEHSQKELNSLRILMAEDDKLNQALAKVQLKKLGCEYHVVEKWVVGYRCHS